MNADRLLEVYEQISEAPDAIARLRRFVLDLAVRGKLVEQDAGDEPASILVRKLGELRQRLISEGTIKAAKKLEPSKASGLAFDAPTGWIWAQANDLWDFENGDRSKNYPSKDQLVESGVPFINAGHLQGGLVSMTDMNFITREKFDQLGGGKLKAGDQLYCLRGSLGKHARYTHDFPGAIASSLVILRPIEPETVSYLALYLDSGMAQEMLRLYDNGTAQPNLSAANLRKFAIPLPPLAEQHRIVAKVDELMSLCDRLEEARKAREEVRDKLTAASLARLTAPDTTARAEPAKVGTGFASGSATSEDDFPTHAAFALEILPALTTRPDQIKTLRQTILNLAVRGKLVEQDPADEPASELLQRAEADIVEFEKNNGVRPNKVDPISSVPFTVPHGWSWARLANVFRVVTDGDHQPPPRAETGVAFLTIGNVSSGTLQFDGCRRVPQSYFDALPGYRIPRSGDLLYTVVGATFGRPVIVDEHEPFCVQRHIAILKPANGMSLQFLGMLMASPFTYAQAEGALTGAAQPTLALKPLRNFMLPIPPLTEQHRIVAKVDALMALCDRLEAALTTTDTTRTRLLEALLHEALIPNANPDMEAAE